MDNYMRNPKHYAKKNKANKKLYFLILFPLVITGLFFYALYQGVAYIERRDLEIYNNAYEIGRFDQLNEDEEALSAECFKISKNEELNRLLKTYFKDCHLAKTMWAIAQAESAGKQTAVGKNRNGSYDSGWLQVNTIHRKKGETKEQFIKRMHDLEENVKEAKAVLDKQGLTAWVTFNTKKYLTYMK